MTPRTRERALLAALFGLVPLIFVFTVLLPSRKRMEAKQARMRIITARLDALPAIQPLSPLERSLLADPRARWRTRIPLLVTDADRFAQYQRVVSGLQGAWKGQGVALQGVRASLDVLNGSFSLPGDLGHPDLGLPVRDTSATGQVQGWVLDARIGGKPDRLFQAMASLAWVDPLLEPVGIRWESTPEHTRQFLLLRNLYLAP